MKTVGLHPGPVCQVVGAGPACQGGPGEDDFCCAAEEAAEEESGGQSPCRCVSALACSPGYTLL